VDFGCLTLEDSVDLIASHLRASVASTEGFHASYLRTSSVESYRRIIAWDSRGLSNAIDQPPAFHIACSPTTTFPYASIPDRTKAVIQTVLWWLSLRGDSSSSVGSSGAGRTSGRTSAIDCTAPKHVHLPLW